MLALVMMLACATPQEQIAKGEEALAALEYDAAAFSFMSAATDPAASDEQRLRANLLAGIAHRVLGKDLDARLNFRYVLLHAPATKLPADTPPKVSFFFESVRQEIDAERGAAALAPSPSPAPAPATTTNPVSGATAAPVDEGPSAVVITGGIIAALGVALALPCALGVATTEHDLDDPTRTGAERTALRETGATFIGMGVAMLAIVGVGGALVVWGGP